MATEDETNRGELMIVAKTQFKATPQKVVKATDNAAYRSMFHAAGSIRKSARESIVRGNRPGPPGGPVRTKRGRGGGLAKRSILYAANKEGAVIGFASSRIDDAMKYHEHGKTRGGVQMPQRPTMQPALERNLARFHREWRWAIY